MRRNRTNYDVTVMVLEPILATETSIFQNTIEKNFNNETNNNMIALVHETMLRAACLIMSLIQQVKSVDNVNGKLKLLYFTFTFSVNSLWCST